jgi:sirohydrochlorin ferrochelatase
MSGTRSPSRKAPATEALIVAHGQPSDPAPAEAEIAALAARVAEFLPGWGVRGATLAMPGALEAALAEAGAPPVVYPLFMSDGWFTSKELRRRLAGAEAKVVQPLGLDPALAMLAASEVAARAEARGWPLAEVTLVIAAHGSGRSENAARATRSFADRLRERLPLAALRVGFVEQSPTIEEAAARAGPRAICLPFFAARGGHVLEDVPQALSRAGFAGDLAEPIGAHPRIPEMIAESIRAASGQPDDVGAMRA